MVLVVSETQQPAPLSWVDHWERGLDPWHADAFNGTPLEGAFAREKIRKTGWYAIDWCGNVVGFVADGAVITEITDTPLATNDKDGAKQ